MNRAITFIAVFLLVFAVILGAIWFLGGKKGADSTGQGPDKTNQQSPGGDLTQKSGDTNPGNASVDVTLITEDNASEFNSKGFDPQKGFDLNKDFIFYVELNTHSVGLTEFKMEDISTLQADGKEIKVPKWANPEDGGHHRSGFLVFERVAKAKNIELVIKGIPSVAERKFEWTL